MSNRIIAAFLFLLTGLPASGGPIAEVICAPRDEMVQRLTVIYGARLAGSGLRDAEAVMEVWANPKGDWTLVQSSLDGISCILAMGADWDMPRPADAG